MDLYNLTGQMVQLQEMLSTGEINEEIYNDTLESLDVSQKVESICYVIRNLQADAEKFKAEKDRLAAKQQTAENSVKRLKESLLNHLLITEQKRVKSGLFSVSVGNSEKVVITNQKEIPKEFLIEQAAKVDVAGIKKAIKAGGAISGATIESNPFLTIR